MGVVTPSVQISTYRTGEEQTITQQMTDQERSNFCVVLTKSLRAFNLRNLINFTVRDHIGFKSRTETPLKIP